MVIELSGISKKFRTWIFKDINLRFESPSSYSVIGHNGSGKSTFLKILSGYMTPTNGTVTYSQNDVELSREEFPLKFSFAAPYIGLIEELTVREQIDFHSRFRSLRADLGTTQFLEEALLLEHQDKFVNQLSSGLMQRLKLALMLMTDSEVLLLDEPTSYLDKDARGWFERLFHKYRSDRLVVLATNDERDVSLCDQTINIEDYC